jgi:hypothetical protein
MLTTAILLLVATIGTAALPAPAERAHRLEAEVLDFRHWASGSYSIRLSVSGEVTRDGDPPLGPDYVPPAVRKSLRELVERERYFDLPKRHGTCYVDGRARMLTVKLDGRAQEITICDMEKTGREPAHTRRALRVWYGILTALSNPGAVFVEAPDRRVLERKTR